MWPDIILNHWQKKKIFHYHHFSYISMRWISLLNIRHINLFYQGISKFFSVDILPCFLKKDCREVAGEYFRLSSIVTHNLTSFSWLTPLQEISCCPDIFKHSFSLYLWRSQWEGCKNRKSSEFLKTEALKPADSFLLLWALCIPLFLPLLLHQTTSLAIYIIRLSCWPFLIHGLHSNLLIYSHCLHKFSAFLLKTIQLFLSPFLLSLIIFSRR